MSTGWEERPGCAVGGGAAAARAERARSAAARRGDARRGAGRLAAWLLAAVFATPAWANSCLLDRDDARQLGGRSGKLNELSIGKVAVQPCEGRVVQREAQVLYSRSPGITQIARVRPGTDLREAVPQPLLDIAAPGGVVGAIWKSLTAPRPLRPGSKRFDGKEILPMGGQLLAGRDLLLPLAAFDWQPDAPVQLEGPAGSLALQPQGGRLLLPGAALKPGTYTLRQGRLAVPLEVVTMDEFDGLAGHLTEIEAGSPDRATRVLRETLLFWELGLVLNAVDADARR